MPEACTRCGVRADIGCKHRPAEGSAPVQGPPKTHANTRKSGQGWTAFHKPSKEDFERIARNLFK